MNVRAAAILVMVLSVALGVRPGIARAERCTAPLGPSGRFYAASMALAKTPAGTYDDAGLVLTIDVFSFTREPRTAAPLFDSLPADLTFRDYLGDVVFPRLQWNSKVTSRIVDIDPRGCSQLTYAILDERSLPPGTYTVDARIPIREPGSQYVDRVSTPRVRFSIY
jgi:hypothetical protein